MANVRSDDGILCHHIAFGSKAGASTIFLTRHATTHSLIEPEDSIGSETTTVVTVSAFVERHGIPQIDLLKIDAEGSDLDVPRGAQKLLAVGRIRFVLAEVGFSPGDHRHVLFDEVRSFLTPFGFRLFRIYDQQVEWSGPRFIRFANVCFCHGSVFGL